MCLLEVERSEGSRSRKEDQSDSGTRNQAVKEAARTHANRIRDQSKDLH